MKVALVQYNPVWENKIENQKKIDEMLQKDLHQSDLVILPEMTLTGFTMKAEKYCEDLKGESIKYFSGLAKTYNINIIAGMILKENDNHFNALIHLDEKGDLRAVYKKTHPFSYSTENLHYKRGEKPVVSKVNNWKIGLAVCYDLRFPELYRFYAKERVELIITIANWPDTRIEHWKSLLRARAIENQCYSIGVNRVGDDPKLHYNGFSGVFDPMGNEIVLIKNKEEIIYCDMDINKVYETRKSLPFLDDIYLI
jgi:omega-amidase